ncbi:MAG: hypothetical protein VZR31_06855 [Lachnospiraceae bacterium]|nr:hypothetical protein [Lachnospiraceae bacterium]
MGHGGHRERKRILLSIYDGRTPLSESKDVIASDEVRVLGLVKQGGTALEVLIPTPLSRDPE